MPSKLHGQFVTKHTYIRVIWRVSYKRQKLLTLRVGSPPGFVLSYLHFWRPEAWTIIGSPPLPATIGQNLRRSKGRTSSPKWRRTGWWMECLKMGHAVKAFPPATRSGYPPLSSSMGLEHGNGRLPQFIFQNLTTASEILFKESLKIHL